ncbi:hypothetical protein KZO25_17260 [Halomonas sp. ANAO-440]|uniref:DUF6447 family protein n=1 Tax=Halomonas sp. ANAO-440 TaxID=2861360 RepID=UPI001CAA4D3B|nr:DUF6447 family protein [Halomonas sp. ANAO-440]MBZ0332067.1 hypothetical protein [Halomonas sp. ANAO-440]
MAEEPQTVTINDTKYKLDELSDEAKAQVNNLRVLDQEIERVRQQMAIYQTARGAYAKALNEALPSSEAKAGAATKAAGKKKAATAKKKTETRH